MKTAANEISKVLYLKQLNKSYLSIVNQPWDFS